MKQSLCHSCDSTLESSNDCNLSIDPVFQTQEKKMTKTFSVLTFTAVLLVLAIISLVCGRQTVNIKNHDTQEEPSSPTFSRICYFSIQNGLHFSAINGTLCTHVLIGFARVENVTLIPQNATDLAIYQQVKPFKRRYPEVKVMLSVGGGGNYDGFHQAASNLYNRIKFSISAVNMLTTYGFDGLDVDWEFPGWHDTWPEDQYLFVLLLKQLKTFFHKPYLYSNLITDRLHDKPADHFLLSAAVTGDYTVADPSYLYAEIAKYVDFINLMTYDYHKWVPILPFTGLNSPLFARDVEKGYFATLNTAWSAYYWFQKGMPKEKIMIGIPLYARAYELVLPDINGIGAPSKYGLGDWTVSQVCGLLADKAHGAQRVWDPEAQVPYAFRGQTWVTYEDAESVQAKIRWVLANGFGGVMSYNLNSDDWQGRSCSRVLPGFENLVETHPGGGYSPDRFPLQTLIYNLTSIL